MTQLTPPKIKFRDFVFGFFGWWIFDTLAFLFFLPNSLLYAENGNLIIFTITLLLSFAITLVLFIKKRIWACVGVIAAPIANFAIWKFVGESAYYYVTYPITHILLFVLLGYRG
jgi:hypothetical protein